MIDIPRQEWRTNLAAINSVPVSLGAGRLARVEACGNFLDIQNSNGARQNMVQSFAKIRQGYGRLDRNGSHLSQGVDARIRAAGTLRECYLSGYLFDNGH